MGFQNIGSSKGCQVGARHLRNVHAPKRKHASIKMYQVALIREPVSQSKDRLLCAPGPSEKTPPKLTESDRPNPPLQHLLKQSTRLCGLTKKKVLEENSTLQQGSWINKSQEVTLLGHGFSYTS